MNGHCQKLAAAKNAARTLILVSAEIDNVIGCQRSAVPGVAHGTD